MSADGFGSRNGTTTEHRPVPEPRVSPWPGLVDRLPRSRRQRRPAFTALGVLLVAGFAALSASLVAGGNHTVAVLALARDVPAGHVVVPGDLRIARISGSGVSALAASAQ